MLIHSQSPHLTASAVVLSRANPAPLASTRDAAQARERLLDAGRYVDVVTGDLEKDFYTVGRMWLADG